MHEGTSFWRWRNTRDAIQNLGSSSLLRAPTISRSDLTHVWLQIDAWLNAVSLTHLVLPSTYTILIKPTNLQFSSTIKVALPITFYINLIGLVYWSDQGSNCGKWTGRVSNTAGTKELGGHNGMSRGTGGLNPNPSSIRTLDLINS